MRSEKLYLWCEVISYSTSATVKLQSLRIWGMLSEVSFRVCILHLVEIVSVEPQPMRSAAVYLPRRWNVQLEKNRLSLPWIQNLGTIVTNNTQALHVSYDLARVEWRSWYCGGLMHKEHDDGRDFRQSRYMIAWAQYGRSLPARKLVGEIWIISVKTSWGSNLRCLYAINLLCLYFGMCYIGPSKHLTAWSDSRADHHYVCAN